MLVHVLASRAKFPSQFSESSTIPLRVFPDICGVRCVCNKWIPFTRVSRSFSLASTVPHRNFRRLPKTAFLAFMTAFPLRSTKISESFFCLVTNHSKSIFYHISISYTPLNVQIARSLSLPRNHSSLVINIWKCSRRSEMCVEHQKMLTRQLINGFPVYNWDHFSSLPSYVQKGENNIKSMVWGYECQPVIKHGIHGRDLRKHLLVVWRNELGRAQSASLFIQTWNY